MKPAERLSSYLDALRPIVYVPNFDFNAVDELNYIELPLNYDGNGDFPMVEIPDNVTTFKVYDNNAGYGANLDKG